MDPGRVADAIEEILDHGTGRVDTEVIFHVRGDGATCDDGTPVCDTVIAELVSQAFLRVLIHNAGSRPINASGRQRHPTARQRRVVKERDRSCVDCGRHDLGEYDHVPAYETTRHTHVDELQLRCAPCHRKRHHPPNDLNGPAEGGTSTSAGGGSDAAAVLASLHPRPGPIGVWLAQTSTSTKNAADA